MKSRIYRDLCFNMPGEPIYGEFTKSGCEKIIKALQIKDNDIVLDIGSGSGFFLTCVAAWCQERNIQNVRLRGVEVSATRCEIAKAMVSENKNIQIRCQNVLHCDTVPFAATKIYAFDKAFPPAVMAHIHHLMDSHGSPVEIFITTHRQAPDVDDSPHTWSLLEKFSCVQYGSGASHMIYGFHKDASSV